MLPGWCKIDLSPCRLQQRNPRVKRLREEKKDGSSVQTLFWCAAVKCAYRVLRAQASDDIVQSALPRRNRKPVSLNQVGGVRIFLCIRTLSQQRLLDYPDSVFCAPTPCCQRKHRTPQHRLSILSLVRCFCGTLALSASFAASLSPPRSRVSWADPRSVCNYHVEFAVSSPPLPCRA